MSFHAKVLRVLIASPSDVKKQRNEVEEAIFLWNKQYAEDLNIVLLPSRWESDVPPSYNGSDPQQVINKVLVERCDILIGIFWTKIGSPTSSYSSGTLEEINIFIEQKKEIMLYFVSENIPHDTNLEEFEQLKVYKNKYRSEGIYSTYDSQAIINHLYQKVIRFKKNEGIDENAVNDQVFLEKQKLSLEELILSNKLTEIELILLAYIIDTGNRYFGISWNDKETLNSIEKWQKGKSLYTTLLENYSAVINNFVDRQILYPKNYTNEGNVKLYVMPIEDYDLLRQISLEAQNKINSVIDSFCYELPF